MKKTVIWAVLLTAVAVAGYIAYTKNNAGSESSYVTELVGRGDITAQVSATGRLDPKVSVLVGSEVSGTIRQIYVDNNSAVRKGQVLLRLDQDVIKGQVEQARARVASAQAQLKQLESGREMNRSQVRTNIDQAKSAAQKASADLERSKLLFNRGMIARAELDAAMDAEAAAMAKYNQSLANKGNYDVIDAQIEAAGSAVREAKAALATAETNLSKTVITSPMDGVVISRNVEVGQTVAASFSTPELLNIGDLSVMEVDVSIDEADVGRVKVGQSARFTVDAFPGREFIGRVSEIYYAPVVVQNVVTYSGIVEVENPDRVLRPGMTANVEVVTSQKKGVTMVPNAALRVRLDIPEAKGVRPPAGRRTVWVMKGKKPAPAFIETGITDYVNTEVIFGLSDGDEVVVDALGAGDKPAAARDQRPGGMMRLGH